MGKELMWLPCPNKFDECSFECHGIDMSNFTGSINSYCKNSDLKNVYLHDVIYAGSSFNLFNDYVNVDKADADDTVLETAKFYPYFKYPVKGSIDTYEGGLWNCQSHFISLPIRQTYRAVIVQQHSGCLPVSGTLSNTENFPRNLI